MSVHAWAEVARQDRFRQDAVHQHAIDNLETVLEGKEDPDRAASTIASLYEPLLKQGLETSPAFELWGMFCDAARVLGDDSNIDVRAINLLNSISKLPIVTDGNGNPVTPGKFWSEVY